MTETPSDHTPEPSDRPGSTPLSDLIKDSSFLQILLGGLIWLLGFYIPIIGPFLTTAGFALVCLASSITAFKRPIDNAWPGLMLGGIIHVVGQYLPWTIVLAFLSPLFIVCGSVLIIFFAVPLALQRGEIPIVKNLQDRLK